jgi:hypothetical protein
MSVPILFEHDGTQPTVTLLSPAIHRPRTDFETVAGRLHLAQALWFAGLAATAFALFAAARTRARLLAALPVVVATVVAVPLLPSSANAYVPDTAAATPVCTPDLPRVCVRRVHAEALGTVTGPAREALAILAARLPQAPTTVLESRTSWIDENREPQPPDTLLTELHPDARGRVDPDELRWRLLDGAGTRACLTIFEPGAAEGTVARHHAARMAAAAWLLGRPPPTDVYYAGMVREALAAVAALSPEEQRARVGALRGAALACDGRDLLTVLTGAGPR